MTCEKHSKMPKIVYSWILWKFSQRIAFWFPQNSDILVDEDLLQVGSPNADPEGCDNVKEEFHSNSFSFCRGKVQSNFLNFTSPLSNLIYSLQVVDFIVS